MSLLSWKESHFKAEWTNILIESNYKIQNKIKEKLRRFNFFLSERVGALYKFSFGNVHIDFDPIFFAIRCCTCS